ncbi:MAG: hypothetical protein AMXMBFR13_19570 [Phycisphaerae bacterium]
MVLRSGPKAGYASFEAVNPDDGKTHEVFVSPRRMQAVARRGEHAIREMAWVVSEVLRKPGRIFEGIRWEEDCDSNSPIDEWLCYAGIPSVDFRTPDSDVRSDPRPGKIFLIFVNVERVAYNWRWEPIEDGTIDLPIGASDVSNPRFGKQVL